MIKKAKAEAKAKVCDYYLLLKTAQMSDARNMFSLIYHTRT